MNTEEMYLYNNMRKHMSQFTRAEETHIRKRVDALKGLRLRSHLIDRIHQKNIYITHEELAYVLIDYDVVEYRIKDMEERVVIRSRESFYGEDYCIVISLTEDDIVTIWKNRSTDLHTTLNETLYNKNMKVF